VTDREQFTPDDSVTCGLCGKETSVAMIARHLEDEHDIDPDEIADAPVIDRTLGGRDERSET